MNSHKAHQVARNIGRLAILKQYNLLDSETEESFDRLTRLASKITDSPFSLVTLVDADRQFFKSQVGLPASVAAARETSLYYSFCKHVVAENAPLVIADARHHPVLKNILTTPEFDVIAYLGMPLTTSEGVGLGSFCIIDDSPRVWTDREIEIMQELSQLVMSEIELRATLREREASQAYAAGNGNGSEAAVAPQKPDESSIFKATFTQAILDELRLPVEQISTAVTGLLATEEGDRVAGDSLLSEADRRLTQLVNTLTLRAKIYNALAKTSRTVNDFNASAAAACGLVKGAVSKRKEIALTYSFGKNSIPVMAPKALLTHMVKALLQVALEHTDEGVIKVVTKATTSYPSQAQLSLKFPGQRLSKKEARAALKGFQRLPAGENGLRTAVDIAQRFNGELTLKYSSKTGFTVSVALPAVTSN